MYWYDEQLKSRKEADDRDFSEALGSIAAAVMGERLSSSGGSTETVSSAVEAVLRYYRHDGKDIALPEDADDIESQLSYCLQPYGIMHRSVELDEGWYRHAIGPMLGTLKEDGSTVALIPGKVSGYSWFDQKTNKTIKLSRKTAQLLSREAICFYEPLPPESLRMGDLLKFMFRQLNVTDLLLYVGMMGITALLGLLSPMFTKWLFGDVLVSGSTRMLLALAGFMLSYALCSFCISVFQGLVSARVNTKQAVAVEAAVMSRILSLPAGFFREYASGELTQRSLYIRALCDMMFNTVGNIGISSLFSLIYIGQIFAFAPALVLPSLLITVLTLSVSLITTFRQMKITRERMLLASKSGGMTYAMISGVQKIKLAGAEKRMFSRWAKLYAQEASLAYDPPLFLKLSTTLNLAITLLGGIVLYYLAVRNGVSIADYYAFNAAYGMIAAAFTSFAGIAVTAANIKPTLEMAKPILEAIPETGDGKELVRSLDGSIELSNVSFRYNESMPYVIDELSLKINKGEFVALVGSTGCGKSTLMRLLLGFETPQKGNIYYDRKDISKLDLRSLRRKIGVVMQDSRLFLGDIYSNITISAPQISLDEAWEAARLASLDEDIRKMPMGMHTLITEGQGGISGGQRQRLMIARALAGKPKILMFDEATSALDNITQKKVSEAIDSLRCTRIVIAHRLSTLRHADRIIYLEKGRIAEEGSFEELIAKNGRFAELVERQRLDIDAE